MKMQTNSLYKFLLLGFIYLTLAGGNSLFAQNSTKKECLFLTEKERTRLMNLPSTSPTASLLSAMQARVAKRAISPGLTDKTATTEWWHHAVEYMTDAALIHAVRPTPAVNSWLRACVLDIIRRPDADWAGPGFRAYDGGEMTGTLETAHLTWAIGVSYDLASDLFTDAEKIEIKTALREKGMIPCRRYLDKISYFHNWNCVLLAGYSVAATVLGDDKEVAYANLWLPIVQDNFQPDGSYGESLQYGNYAANSLTVAQEALLRYNPSKKITLEPYGRMVNWSSYALLYRKPLSGWPIMDWPRTVNFGDTGSIFRPSGDLLIHIAARGGKELPLEAGQARWLFDTLYFPANEPGPHDLASFGFVNGFGFLSVIMYADAVAAISPTDAKLPTTKAFSCGDAFARDSWGGLTTLAARLVPEPRHATPHIHGDINSFMLIYNKERLLVDPGHTCYREPTRVFDISSAYHNTCTFETVSTESKPSRILTQITLEQAGVNFLGGKSKVINRPLTHEGGVPHATPPLDLGGKRLITSRIGSVSVLGSDAAALYEAPLQKFERFWILCGSHALFVVDHIVSDEPLKTTWNFLLNNRDGLLDFQLNRTENKVSAKRGNAGIKISHYAKNNLVGPINSYMHDAYHTFAGQERSEGEPGSAILMRWNEPTAFTNRTVVHTIAIDDHAGIDGWNTKNENNLYTIEGKDRNENWTLKVAEDGSLSVEETVSHQHFSVTQDAKGVWSLAETKSGKKK